MNTESHPDASPNDDLLIQESAEKSVGNKPAICWCGCGGVTKHRFMPGHDARFHSLAKKVARGLATMPERFVNENARADFLKHHDAERARIAAKATAKVGTSATQAAGGNVAAHGGDEPPQQEPPARTGLQPALLQDFPAGETLCIGIDFAWWGGGRTRPTQTDTLAFAQINGEQAEPLQLKRVDLSTTYNPSAADNEPNCDADASLVLQAVQEVMASHAGDSRVVLAVDAPLKALDRAHLPDRSRKADEEAKKGKKSSGNTLEFRKCDQAALNSLELEQGRTCWRHVWNVLPGAPLCPRVVALVKGLHGLGFQLYSDPATDISDRLLIECFPGEALWFLGALGKFAPFLPGETKEYKSERLRDPRLWNLPGETAYRPWPIVLQWVYQGLYGFADRDVLGVTEEVFAGWMADLTRHLLTDGLVMDTSRRKARRGKLLDDLVESVNCFLTAVSFVRNRAHVWVGDDPADGHIVGPGR